MLMNPTYAAATVTAAQADAMVAAANNDGGAMAGFMGMGMAMNAGGNAANLYAMVYCVLFTLNTQHYKSGAGDFPDRGNVAQRQKGCRPATEPAQNFQLSTFNSQFLSAS